MWTIRVVFVLVAVVSLCDGRLVPFTPCGSLFNYWESQTWDIFGAMTFKNDLSGEYRLEVEMSIPKTTTKNISIRRVTPEHEIKEGKKIEYYVGFPYNHTFPLLTKVTFQGKVYCTGPPAKDEGDGVTALSTIDVLVTQLNADVTTTSTTTFPILTSERNALSDPSCGVAEDTKPLVFNGAPTRSGEYPWLVAMFNVGKDDADTFRCAATLVTKQHVITAAHCVEPEQIRKEDIALLLGAHNIKKIRITSTVRFIESIHSHPDYKQPGQGDISVLKMSKSVDYTRTIRPICLWGGNVRLDAVVGRQGTVVGWGRDENNNNFVVEPRKINMPIVSQEECLRSDDRFLKITSSTSFCAGFRNGSIPCTGDSGGGFYMKQGTKYTLRGVVSAALADSETSTCDAKHYAVFVDVSQYDQWLTTILKG